jgi:hypothetical protein
MQKFAASLLFSAELQRMPLSGRDGCGGMVATILHESFPEAAGYSCYRPVAA